MTCTHCGEPAVQQLEGTTGNRRRVTDLRCGLHAAAESQLGGQMLTGTGTRYRLARILPVGTAPEQPKLELVSREANLETAFGHSAGRFAALVAGGIHVWDGAQRIYLLRRRTTDNWHIVRALPADDAAVRSIDNPMPVGTLSCVCPGGQYHGHCWALDAVARYEADLEQDSRWDLPA